MYNCIAKAPLLTMTTFATFRKLRAHTMTKIRYLELLRRRASTVTVKNPRPYLPACLPTLHNNSNATHAWKLEVTYRSNLLKELELSAEC